MRLSPPKPDTAYPYQKRTAYKSTYAPRMTQCCCKAPPPKSSSTRSRASMSEKVAGNVVNEEDGSIQGAHGSR